MNILVLGNGGREHALSWKIAQSPKCQNLYIAPGNAGTKDVGTNVNLDIIDFDSVSKFVVDQSIEMVLVGPELPLVHGITDFLEGKHEGLIVIGPTQVAAELEGSKAFAKEFMKEFDIPTADYLEVDQSNLQQGIDHIRNTVGPYVLKADGLAGGKGVLIIHETEEAVSELKEMLSGKFGNASSKVVIEEFLDGIEFSVFALTDGTDYVLLPIAKDYKRVGEGDQGLNTGGMGAVSPVPFVNSNMLSKVKEKIVAPTIHGLKSRDMRYRGFVFFGLISVKGEPKVIEYNCRMGDPETQVVIPRLENDLVDLFLSMNEGTLSSEEISAKEESAVTVICASGGYPESYNKGYEINGIDEVSDSLVFHAGTKLNDNDNRIITSGGRVLAVTSFGKDKDVAVRKSLLSIEKINFKDKYLRKDIGFDL